ncbi:MAG: protein disulfide oxidoreductase [Thermoplasmatota archaeon]
MTIMDEATKEKVLEAMEVMTGPVHILLFTDDEGCPLCGETQKIVEEVSELSGKLTHETIKIKENEEIAKKFGVDRTPAILVMKGTPDEYKYLGVRFFGIPAGYEFTSLLDSVLTASRGETAISDEAKKYLKELEKDVHLQVFVTPTCPYCPRAVVLAHHMAMESDRVVADMVEATEFPELSQKYNVMGVPRTVINEDLHQEGAAPERMIMDLVKKAVQG